MTEQLTGEETEQCLHIAISRGWPQVRLQLYCRLCRLYQLDALEEAVMRFQDVQLAHAHVTDPQLQSMCARMSETVEQQVRQLFTIMATRGATPAPYSSLGTVARGMEEQPVPSDAASTGQSWEQVHASESMGNSQMGEHYAAVQATMSGPSSTTTPCSSDSQVRMGEPQSTFSPFGRAARITTPDGHYRMGEPQSTLSHQDNATLGGMSYTTSLPSTSHVTRTRTREEQQPSNSGGGGLGARTADSQQQGFPWPAWQAVSNDDSAREDGHIGSSGWSWSADEWRGRNWWQYQGSWSSDKHWSRAEGSERPLAYQLEGPPAWMGWQHFREFKGKLRRWSQNTALPPFIWWDKLMGLWSPEEQRRFQYVSDEDRYKPSCIDTILQILAAEHGEREGDEERRQGREFLDWQRHDGETHCQFVDRRRAQFNAGVAMGCFFSDKMRAIMMEEGAHMRGQTLENFQLLTGGKLEFEAVCAALRTLDTRRSQSLQSKGRDGHMYEDENNPHGWTGVADGDGSALRDTEDNEEEDEVPEPRRDFSDLSDEQERECLISIEQQEVYEDEIPKVLDILYGQRRTSWNESRSLKLAQKRDREYFKTTRDRTSAPRGDRNAAPKRSQPRPRLNEIELILKTKCSWCGIKGHWRAKAVENGVVVMRECTNPPDARAKERQRRQGGKSLYFDASTSSSAFTSLVTLDRLVAIQQEIRSDGVYLTTDSSHALVDTGAAGELSGLQAFQAECRALKEAGIRPIPLSVKARTPHGIGGAATAIGTYLFPCFPGGGGQCVYFEKTVIKEDVPNILGVALLDFLEADMSLTNNSLHLAKMQLSIPMTQMPSHHRVIKVTCDMPTSIDLPESLKTKYPWLTSDAFQWDSNCRDPQLSDDQHRELCDAMKSPCAERQGATLVTTQEEPIKIMITSQDTLQETPCPARGAKRDVEQPHGIGNGRDAAASSDPFNGVLNDRDAAAHPDVFQGVVNDRDATAYPDVFHGVLSDREAADAAVRPDVFQGAINDRDAVRSDVFQGDINDRDAAVCPDVFQGAINDRDAAVCPDVFHGVLNDREAAACPDVFQDVFRPARGAKRDVKQPQRSAWRASFHKDMNLKDYHRGDRGEAALDEPDVNGKDTGSKEHRPANGQSGTLNSPHGDSRAITFDSTSDMKCKFDRTPKGAYARACLSSASHSRDSPMKWGRKEDVSLPPGLHQGRDSPSSGEMRIPSPGDTQKGSWDGERGHHLAPPGPPEEKGGRREQGDGPVSGKSSTQGPQRTQLPT